MTKQLVDKIKKLLIEVKCQGPRGKIKQDPSYVGLVDLIIEFEYFWQGIRGQRGKIMNNKEIFLDKELDKLEHKKCPVIKLRKNKTIKQVGWK